MPVDYNFQRGVDLPNWQWLAQFPVISTAAAACCYDEARYMYFVQSSFLYRYDTWTNGWHVLNTSAAGSSNTDVEYDRLRNVIYITTSGTSWKYFNLNPTAITIGTITTAAFTLSANMAPALPSSINAGGALAKVSDADVPAVLDSGVAGVGSTTTTIVAGAATFTYGMVACQLRWTSGANSGEKRIVASVTNSTTLVVSAAFSNAPTAGDAWTLELPADTAASGSTSTTLVTAGGLATNSYASSDVVVTGGTGSGQRRRIASNTATTLTLTAAVTGNPRTGAWATTPDVTSTYQIVPSSDFLYYQVPNSLWRLDCLATSSPAWVSLTAPSLTPGSMSVLMHPGAAAPFHLFHHRGAGSAAVDSMLFYSIGLNTWSAKQTIYAGDIIWTAGSSFAMIPGRRRLFVHAGGSNRCGMWNMATSEFESCPSTPYMDALAVDGRRARYVKTAQGVEYIYLLRTSGQEFWRLPLEWL